MRMLCVGRPADWWLVPDEGNRLALLICSVCPAIEWCRSGDPEPHAVIRAGVAYDIEGRVVPICACGRPAVESNLRRTECFTCKPHDRIPLPVIRRSVRGAGVRHAARILELHGAGWTYRQIGLSVGMSLEAVRGVVRKHRRPQAVSTVVDTP